MLGMSLIDLFLGSPTMVVLLICSIVTVSYAFERGLYFLRTRTDVTKFMKGLAGYMTKQDLPGAVDYCNRQQGSAARVVGHCLEHLDLKRSEMQQRFNTAIEVEQVEMERNLSVLGTMSNIAPLLGLFGTVIGIIRAFADIARAGAGGSAVVAMGVSEALLTTAAGIVVAVIATVFFNVFVRRIRTRIIELEDVREEFFLMARVIPVVHERQAEPCPAAAVASPERIYETVEEQEAEREPVASNY